MRENSWTELKRSRQVYLVFKELEVIIVDELLNPRHAYKFMQLLEKLSSEGKTIILSTHDVDLAYSWQIG